MARAKVTEQFLYENFLAGRVIRPVRLKADNPMGWGAIELVNTVNTTEFPNHIRLGVLGITVGDIKIDHHLDRRWKAKVLGPNASVKALEGMKRNVYEMLANCDNFEFEWVNFNEGESANTNYSSVTITRNRGKNNDKGGA